MNNRAGIINEMNYPINIWVDENNTAYTQVSFSDTSVAINNTYSIFKQLFVIFFSIFGATSLAVIIISLQLHKEINKEYAAITGYDSDSDSDSDSDGDSGNDSDSDNNETEEEFLKKYLEEYHNLE